MNTSRSNKKVVPKVIPPRRFFAERVFEACCNAALSKSNNTAIVEVVSSKSNETKRYRVNKAKANGKTYYFLQQLEKATVQTHGFNRTTSDEVPTGEPFVLSEEKDGFINLEEVIVYKKFHIIKRKDNQYTTAAVFLDGKTPLMRELYIDEFNERILPALISKKLLKSRKKAIQSDVHFYTEGQAILRAMRHPAITKVSPNVFFVDASPYPYNVTLDKNQIKSKRFKNRKQIYTLDPNNLKSSEEHQLLIALIKQELQNKNELKESYDYVVNYKGEDVQVALTTDIVKRLSKKKSRFFHRLFSEDQYKYQIIDRLENEPKLLGKGATAEVVATSNYGEIIDNEFITTYKPMALKRYKDKKFNDLFDNEQKFLRENEKDTKIVFESNESTQKNILVPLRPGKSIQKMLIDEDFESYTNEDFKDMMVAIATAINDLHVKGYVHGDLSTGNIIYDFNTKTAYLIDNGHTKLAANLDSYPYGTDQYMAPEIYEYYDRKLETTQRDAQLLQLKILQLKTNPQKILTYQSDIYSLGVIFDQILGGFKYIEKSLLKPFRKSAIRKFESNQSTLQNLLENMYNTDPNARPNSNAVLTTLKEIHAPNRIEYLKAIPAKKQAIAALEKEYRKLSRKHQKNPSYKTEHELNEIKFKIEDMNYAMSSSNDLKQLTIQNIKKLHDENWLDDLQRKNLISVINKLPNDKEICHLPNLFFSVSLKVAQKNMLADKKELAKLIGYISSSTNILGRDIPKLFAARIFPPQGEYYKNRLIAVTWIDDYLKETRATALHSSFEPKRRALIELRDMLTFTNGDKDVTASDILKEWKKIKHTYQRDGKKIEIDNLTLVSESRSLFFKNSSKSSTKGFIVELEAEIKRIDKFDTKIKRQKTKPRGK